MVTEPGHSSNRPQRGLKPLHLNIVFQWDTFENAVSLILNGILTRGGSGRVQPTCSEAQQIWVASPDAAGTCPSKSQRIDTPHV